MFSKSKFAHGIVWFIVITLLFGFAGSPNLASGASTGMNGTKGELVVSQTISTEEQKAALEFWTREAIANAQPMELLSQKDAPVIDESAQKEPEIVGEMGFKAPGAPASDADTIAQKAYPLDWAMMQEGIPSDVGLLDPDGTSQVYTYYTVNQASTLQTMYPHRWVGRLSFWNGSSTSYCSGTAISGNVMLTAANCLYNTTNNTWYSNWIFTPAYRDGSAPYGSFPASNCWVLTAWVNLTGNYSINSWARHDVGVCTMGTNSAGQTLNGAVGAMGRQWDASYARLFFDLGYPFKNYNNSTITDAGKFLRTCVAESFQQTTDTRGMGCYYGGGFSGGPWVGSYKINSGGFVDGVNSGFFIGTQNIYGARFTSNNIVILCNSAGC